MEVESHIISLKNLLRRLLVLSSSIKSGLLSRSVLYQHSPTLRFFFKKYDAFKELQPSLVSSEMAKPLELLQWPRVAAAATSCGAEK